MTVEDVDEALIDSVCARLHEQLHDGEAGHAEAFARQYYRWVSPDDLAERTAIDLYGAALSHFNLARTRTPGEPKLRVYNPEFDQNGWQSTHTAVEIVTDDMPFLIDSVTMELNRRDFGVHLIIHPVMNVRRDDAGHLAEVIPPHGPASDALAESVIHAEVTRQTDPAELNALRGHLLRVIGEVRAAVEDWPLMRRRAREISDELNSASIPIDAAEIAEVGEFLTWLEDHHFTFLGYRDYDIVDQEGEPVLAPVEGSGLGILRRPSDSGPRRLDDLPPGAQQRALEPSLLNLTKANSRATVHRPAYLDYIGIKRIDASGKVVGERRFLGLYTTSAYRTRPHEIPILRRKLNAVLARAAFPRGSHNEKALVEILETHPRDELLQVDVDELFGIVIGILHLGERQRVRLFVRRDTFGRFLSCLVFVPRDRFNTENRRRIESILRVTFRGSSIDYTTRVSESVSVRLHYMIYLEPGTAIPAYDAREIEVRLVAATRSWADDLESALMIDHGEETGTALARRYRDAFPAGYRADWVARSAVADVRRIEALAREDDIAITVYRPLEAPLGQTRAKLFRSGGPLALSDMLPVFENMGVDVADERPYEVTATHRDAVWIYDFGLTYVGDDELDADHVRQAFEEAFIRAWRGDVENDGYNRLLLGAQLTWREITVIRSVARYLRQAGTTFSDAYVRQAVIAHPEVARLLVNLFHARFDPEHADPDAAERIVQQIEQAIDAVESLDQDRILRAFLAIVRAMLRTNYFRTGADGGHPLYLSFKLDPAGLPWLPLPRPRFEIFVYSPRTEGVHLRGGKVARGGLRWSDRREDFRTEVLGLMKAQMVKNAVIVPVGAKGGFVVKRPPAGGDRSALLAEVERCYRTFICGLLDLTDNIEAGDLVPPPGVVRYDDDDPYLVVAADRGTAALSDTANAIAGEYGFWLDDAFASGGATGYDHKKMGITARGAWESVKRHFRELGRDIQNEDFTVVGIGDMSGDVFGNGMLLSRHIRLVAAFDHRHVFIDPEPDAERSFEERRRLFDLPRSSWADFDLSVISEGGGVYARTAKSISLSPQARAALDIDAESLTPHELIRLLLRAPVDLLWNGGIGTYVKAAEETHADAGDKSNDGVRVDAGDLRCLVVGEGGNLGLTQRARIEYALAGGRLNTDAIDNAAGVGSSDQEVNIKILLNSAVADGDLTVKQRNTLLAEMTERVSELVLKDTYEQTETLTLAEANAASMLDVHARLMERLEQAGVLDRALEALPDDEAIAARKHDHRGLSRPELATLLSHSKIELYAQLLASDVPEDPHLSLELERYFPDPLPDRFRDRMREHRLWREITATKLVNNIVHGGGSTFTFRLSEETGASAADVARCYSAARDVFRMRDQWDEIEGLDNQVSAQTQSEMLLAGRRLLERGTRWLLRNRRRPLSIAETVEYFAPGAETLYDSVARLLAPADAEPVAARTDELREAGVPMDLATRIAALTTMSSTFDIVEVSHECGLDAQTVAAAHFYLGSELQLHWLRDQIVALPRSDRWAALARAALRDDLNSLHRTLTSAVLADGDAGAGVHELADAWIAASPAAERYIATLADVRLGRVYDLTTLPVVIREVRNLIQAR